MTVLLLCFFLGLVFLGAEVFVPGGILGAVGIVLMLIGVVVTYRDYGTAAGTGALAASLFAGLGLVVLELFLVPRTAFGRRLMLRHSSGAAPTPVAEAASVIGRPAEALTVLAPSGYVNVDGRRYEAFCRAGHVEAGESLRVVAVESQRLVVTRA